MNPRDHGHREPVSLIWQMLLLNSFVKCSNAIAKGANTASRTKRHISDIGTELDLDPEFRPIAISTYYAEQRRAWFGIYHPASLPQKFAQKWPK